jgi:hypothetical protein
MAKEVLNGVTNVYGPRHRHEGQQGRLGSMGADRELVIRFSGDTYLTVADVLPAGAMIVGNAMVEIEEAFVLGGTTPLLNVGVLGSEATNRLAQISEAQAEAVGTYSIASAGTLALNTVLAADAQIRVTLTGGGSNTIGLPGKAKLVIPFRVV